MVIWSHHITESTVYFAEAGSPEPVHSECLCHGSIEGMPPRMAAVLVMSEIGLRQQPPPDLCLVFDRYA